MSETIPLEICVNFAASLDMGRNVCCILRISMDESSENELQS